MTRELSRVVGLALTLLVSASAGTATAEQETSDQGVITVPRSVIDGNNAFAFDLYGALRAEEGNLFFSPYGLTQALAMTWAGAGGETASQMAEALHFGLPPEEIHAGFDGLRRAMTRRGSSPTGAEESGSELGISNALWGQQGLQILPTFRELLAERYDATLHVVDFASQAAEARRRINAWARQETRGHVVDLLPADTIQPDTRLVLTNTVYLKAKWEEPFEERDTSNEPFHLLDGTEVDVPTMHQTRQLRYKDGGSWQALEMPYSERRMSMLVLLPDSGSFERFEADLDAKKVADIVEKLDRRRVEVSMPRFDHGASFELQPQLAALGMPSAFGQGADFSGMTGDQGTALSDVVHNAYVAVDELGTVAAAASATHMGLGEPPIMDAWFEANRPFIFLIRDMKAGTILFVGRVLDPRE